MSKAEELYNQKRFVFSLDEAIEHAKEAAERLAQQVKKGDVVREKCAVEHFYLYRWLDELRTLRQALEVAAENFMCEDDIDDDE